jgi:hypothetical protein
METIQAPGELPLEIGLAARIVQMVNASSANNLILQKILARFLQIRGREAILLTMGSASPDGKTS